MKILFSYFVFLLAVFTISLNVSATTHSAPAGIMGDHIHKKGEFMSMYTVSYINMKGMYKMNQQNAFTQYGQSLEKMRMRMLMAMAMYGVTDNFNIMVMGHFMDMDMTTLMQMGMMQNLHEHQSSGVGDIEISGLFKLFETNSHRSQVNIGLILPTGSIDEKHSMMGNTNRMSYMMQLGSGSYSIHPQWSYTKIHNQYEFGTQIGGTFRLNTNSNGYKLGNIYNFTAWAVKKLESIDLTSRLNYTHTEDISGVDHTLNMSSSATNNPNLQYRKQLDALLGINYILTPNIKFLLEGGMPIYQETGIGMMKNRYIIHLSLQHTL